MTNEFQEAVRRELSHAYAKHGREPWSRHELYGVLLEEVEEVWEQIKRDGPTEEIIKELRQIAGVCQRYCETDDRYRGKHPSVPLRDKHADNPPATGRVRRFMTDKSQFRPCRIVLFGSSEFGIDEETGANTGYTLSEGIRYGWTEITELPAANGGTRTEEPEIIRREDAKRFHFKDYEKIGTTPISDETLPIGTNVQTLEGSYTCTEPSRLAIDVKGNVYPIAESVLEKSYYPYIKTGEPVNQKARCICATLPHRSDCPVVQSEAPRRAAAKVSEEERSIATEWYNATTDVIVPWQELSQLDSIINLAIIDAVNVANEENEERELSLSDAVKSRDETIAAMKPLVERLRDEHDIKISGPKFLEIHGMKHDNTITNDSIAAITLADRVLNKGT